MNTETNGADRSPQILTDPSVHRHAADRRRRGDELPDHADRAGRLLHLAGAEPESGGLAHASPQGLLAVWNSTGKTGTGRFRHRVERDADDVVSGRIVPVHARRDVTADRRHDLDQLAPVAALSITGYMPGGVGPCIPAADCQTFAIGDVICGTYSVTDEHLGGFSLQATADRRPPWA